MGKPPQFDAGGAGVSGPVIHGRCPGALQPMLSADGYVVRVRPPMGRLTSEQARGLAELSERFGSGFVEMTNRANLQIRGVVERDIAPLVERLGALALLDESPEAEQRRNFVINPFRVAGDLHEEMAAALLDALGARDVPQMPSKFGFVIDPGEMRQCADVSGDIRIERSAGGLIVRADGAELGRAASSVAEAAALSVEMVRWFAASGGIGPDGRGRMARHLAGGAVLPEGLAGACAPAQAATAHVGPYADGVCLGVPFGQLMPEQLEALAKVGTAIFVTPFRMIYLPLGAGWPEGFVTDANDARMRAYACAGAPYCAQALGPARALASAVLDVLEAGESLHVSGCAKGCAQRGAADYTLVAIEGGGYDLIRHGKAEDAPVRQALDGAALMRAPQKIKDGA